MDRLTDSERILAWKSSWEPSFAGIAIINPDFTFRSVNPQFCEILGVTPAELIGQKFQDITPPSIREIDLKNAQMVVDGLMDFYILPKSYEFTSGRRVNVVLLVTRAPLTKDGPFQFFVSRIMLDKQEASYMVTQGASYPYPVNSQKLTTTVMDFLVKYWTWIVIAGGAITGAILKIMAVLKIIEE